MFRSLIAALLTLAFAGPMSAQSYIVDSRRESARSDKLTGGIVRSAFVSGEPNIRLTINLPSFQMTLWQNGSEVSMYPVGIGLVDYPVAISLRSARTIEWNPVWIPPSSDWIESSSTVKAGEIVLPTDPRNPLGKVKIPLGYGYLLHQAKGPSDMGSLVSHGCVRVMQKDLYDLAEKIVAARSLNVTPDQIRAAKLNKKTLIADIDPQLSVEITYDTIVVENGKLNVYPDVYLRKSNTAANVRSELKSSGVDDSSVTDREIETMLKRVTGKQKFVANVADIEQGLMLTRGKYTPVILPAKTPAQGKRRGR